MFLLHRGISLAVGPVGSASAPRTCTASQIISRTLAAGLLLLACPPSAGAGVQVWTGTVPRAKSIEAILADPLNPNRFWAASFGSGVSRSLDGGATWTANRTGLINTFVRALACQPHHPDSVYCGTNDGVFLSTDGGLNWSEILSTNTSVRSIAIHPNRTGIIYASTSGLGIYKSTNGGKNWGAVNVGLQNLFVRDVVIDPVHPDTMFAGTGTGGGVHRSVDGGLSWLRSADSTANAGAVEQIVFSVVDPNLIYAATSDRGVIKSSDRGVSWVSINRGLKNFRTRSLAVIDTIRYVGTDGSGVFFTTISDTMWHAANIGLTNLVVDALFTRSSQPGNCWAGTDGGGVFVSSNRAAAWTRLDGGLLDTYGFSVAVRPGPGTVYDGAGFGDQAWRSTNAGAAWTRASYLFSHDSVHGLVPDPVDPQAVYLSAYGSGVYRSLNDGVTWSRPDSLAPSLGSIFVRNLVAYPGQTGHLYVGGGNGVWETLDGGATWTQRAGGLPASFSVRALALVPGVPATLYAGSDSAGVWRSGDGGSTWAAAGPGIPVPFIHALLADAAHPGTVFAATDSGLYRSQNSGASFSPIRGGLPYGLNAALHALAQDNIHPQILFAGTAGSGVFQSIDGGVNWTSTFGEAGLTNLNVRSLAIDGATLTVYAGTDNGVFNLSRYLTPLAVDEPPGSRGVALTAAPNPALGPLRVSCSLPTTGELVLVVMDVDGRRIRTLARGTYPAGPHAFEWDERDERGSRVAPGLYLVHLRTSGTSRTLRIAVTGR